MLLSWASVVTLTPVVAFNPSAPRVIKPRFSWTRHLPSLLSVARPRPCAVPIGFEPELQEVVLPGESRTIGECQVYRVDDRLCLERTQEPGNFVSEWNVAQSCTPHYAGTVAKIAQTALTTLHKSQRHGARVLMLGLGGGTMAGQLLLDGDWRFCITAIEADVDVATAANRYFMPTMFEQTAAGMAKVRHGLRVLHADAIGVVNGAVALHEEDIGPYDIIIEDFAYDQPGRLRAPFWRSLLENLAAPYGLLIINTLYKKRSDLERLRIDLQKAGWCDVRQQVDRGHQADNGDERSPRPEEWKWGDNMIFTARVS